MHSYIGIASPRGANSLHYLICNMSELFYPKLSYAITGICFNAQNRLGRFAKEKLYGDYIEQELINERIPYVREFPVPKTDDRIDFLIDKTVIVELKSKRYLLKEDYYQTQRYLHLMNLKLALLINFQNRHLKPSRVIRSVAAPLHLDS